MATVLIVEDEAKTRKIIKDIVDHFVGCRVIMAGTAQEAIEKVGQELPDLMTLDMMLPGGSGAEVLKGARRIKPDLDVVIITGHGDVPLAFEMGREGVCAFFEKGKFNVRELGEVLVKLLEQKALRDEALSLAGPEVQLASVWASGTSPAIARTLDSIDAHSRTEGSVFFVGEYGTCKQAAARLLHERSRRSQGPFVILDCRNLPQGSSGRGAVEDSRAEAGWIEGLIEKAQGGTLLLHHVHELDLRVQSRFLCLLEKNAYSLHEAPAGVRIMATSTENIAVLLAKELLRKEMGVHLEHAVVDLAPLRERKEDIALIARHLLPGANKRHGATVEAFSQRALKELARRPWAGNLYELWYVVDHAVLRRRDGIVDRGDIPKKPEERSSQIADNCFGQADSAITKALLLSALQDAGGNQTEAARRSGVSKSTFNRLIHSFLIQGEKK